jgi:4-amino-4-deoxy-L-arabinose transferase-like glycosyltransferase
MKKGTSAGRDLVLLAAFAAALFLTSLGSHDLWNPNEPIYGQAVVEMSRGGDWLVPRVNGLVFAEKPILYYWMALAASKALGGVGEWTLRLPSALAGVVSVLAIYLLVAPYAGPRRARISALLLATTHMIFLGSRTVQMDILVEASTLVTLVFVSRAVDRSASSWTWAAAGAVAGLGFLAKGPVAWVCPGFVLVLYLAWTRRLRLLASPAVALGALSAAAVAAPWYALLWARGQTEVLREVLFRQNFARFVEPWDHDAPWWYYLYYFWIDMAPWAWFVPLSAALPGRADEEKRLDRLAWAWIAGILVFFSLSASKRSPYILPLAPAVAILAAGLADRLLADRLPSWRKRAALGLLAATGAVFAAGAALLVVRVLPRYPQVRGAIVGMAITLAAGALAIASGFVASRVSGTRRPAAPAAGFLAALLALELATAIVAFPAADAFKSARPFCEQVRAAAGPDAPVLSWSFWRWRASYTYYLGRPIRNVKSTDELRQAWTGPEPAFLIVEEPGLREARAVLGEAAPLVEARVGETRVYLFRSEPR